MFRLAGEVVYFCWTHPRVSRALVFIWKLIEYTSTSICFQLPYDGIVQACSENANEIDFDVLSAPYIMWSRRQFWTACPVEKSYQRRKSTCSRKIECPFSHTITESLGNWYVEIWNWDHMFKWSCSFSLSLSGSSSVCNYGDYSNSSTGWSSNTINRYNYPGDHKHLGVNMVVTDVALSRGIVGLNIRMA